jgi:hypothetical protein
LGDRRNDGENNCNSGDGTGQMAQPWMLMMMMVMMIMMMMTTIMMMMMVVMMMMMIDIFVN